MLPAVKLELLSRNHAKELYRLTDANRQRLREWLPWLDDIQSSLDTEAFIEYRAREISAGGAPQYAVIHDDKLCGVIGFHAIDRQKRLASIGYWLAEPYVGNGIMSAAVQKIVGLSLKEFDLSNIEIRCATSNARSRAVAERAGFVYQSTVRQCEWLYDHYVDHAVYSLALVKQQH